MNRTFESQSVRTIDKTPTSVLNYPLTPIEATILAAAQEIQFGELLEVEVKDSPERIHMPLTAPQKAFIEALRNRGIRYLDKITVHNGNPQQIELDGLMEGIKYKQKIRFQ
jgi:hypothetical protein